MDQPVKILIVEDEVLIAMCLEMELKQSGYEVYGQIATGEEAVMIAEQCSPDIT